MTDKQNTPSRSPLGALRQFHQPLRPGSPPLLVFPHAGSGASAYRALSELFSREFTVLIMQYPGRQDRMREPAAIGLHDLAAEAYAEYSSRPELAGTPVTVFGHSMGALVGFEFVRLAEQGPARVARLVVSAATAPSLVADLPPHPTDDEGLMAHLSVLEGTGDGVMGSDAVMRMALPVLRADYQAFDAYRASPEDRVATPVSVIGGADDPVIKPHDLHTWSAHADDVEVSVFDGGHFYLHENGPGILDVLTEPAVSGRR
ncbi:alpha/beta fold hydrolase [Gordonia sp. SID5947]|uniref:thioesterase II family protein n=1 Tax=Gordonia sp. SID5947 TaxID=2690315 RepID=UPI00136F40C4|nr:alpha/beta fold hydrolase [Gordonia sp. SID5947]MYR07115.1 alpha/beta fold hydrolase [Gordonia sp. SID5947]